MCCPVLPCILSTQCVLLCRWRSVEFGVRRFKDLKEVYILGEVDDVMQVLGVFNLI
jgi:hypothetical protein